MGRASLVAVCVTSALLPGFAPPLRAEIVIRIDKPRFALTGEQVLVGFRLTTPEGDPVPPPGAVRFTVRASGDASWIAPAATGTIVEQRLPGTVVVESDGGVFAARLSGPTPEVVSLEVVDSAGAGVGASDEVTFDFELGPGGWSGAATVPPILPWALSRQRAASGELSFHSGPIFFGSQETALLSPPLDLRGGAAPRLEFDHWYDFDDCGNAALFLDGGVVEARRLGQAAFTRLTPEGGYPAALNHQPGCFNPLGEPGVTRAYSGNTRGVFVHASLSLDELAGRIAQVRFRFGADCSVCGAREGWYIDNVRVTGLLPVLPFLAPQADDDGDGLDSSGERARGTDPEVPDSDGDGLDDGVETATGVFVGPADTGTSPLDSDSDDGGMSDGREVALGLDPLDRADDVDVPVLAWVAFTDLAQEWPNTLLAIRRFFPDFAVTESHAQQAADLEASLEGKKVFLVPEQENLGEATAYGQRFASVLQRFVRRGGVAVAMMHQGADILRAAGLLDATVISAFGELEPLQLDAAGHPLAAGVAPPVFSQNATASFAIGGAGNEVVLSRPVDGGVVVAARRIGGGAVVLVGFDFFAFDDNTARFAANAIAFSLEFRDTDGDGIPDPSELANGLDPHDAADGGADLDGDGLTNAEEFFAQSSLTNADSDGDGLSDGVEVHDRGTDPLLADTDGDGRGDADDPYGASLITARLELPSAAIPGVPAPLRVLLDGKDGRVAIPVRFEIGVRGDAVLGAAARTGRLLGGGGTGVVDVESQAGVVEIDLIAGSTGSVALDVLDPQRFGIQFVPGFLDFERADGRFTHGGTLDEWEWGEPTTGPLEARSGRRVWATDLEGPYSDNANFSLLTPPFQVPSTGDATLSFWHWFASEPCCDVGIVEVAVSGGAFLPVPGIGEFRGRLPGYSEVRGDLGQFAGRRVRIRFSMITGGGAVDAGWYIDDVTLPGLEARVDVLAPDEDGDRDGVINSDELARGTDPSRDDSDDDGLEDGVETDSGIFVGPEDSGSDPLVADSDGGGMKDGREVAFGLNPIDPADDIRIPVLAWIPFADLTVQVPNTLAAIRSQFPEIALTQSSALDPDELARELEGRSVLLLPAQERLSDGFSLGGVFERTIGDFVQRGGVAVAFSNQSADILRGAGLIDLVLLSINGPGEPLELLAPDHALARGVRRPVQSQLATASWSILSPDAETVLTRVGDGGSVVAARRIGGGAIVLVGFNYFSLDIDAEHFAANAVAFSLEFRDSDGDGIPDRIEVANGLDPADPADGAGDLDGDGLSNRDEFLRRTSLVAADSDGDGLSDREEVERLGTNPLAADTDGDGRDDAEDPFARELIIAGIDMPSTSLVGEGATVRVRLEAAGLDAGAAIPFTLRAGPGAVFAAAARSGRVLRGGGTSAVVLESAGRGAAIDVASSAERVLELSVVDSEGYGIEFDPRRLHDFEANDGGFTHSGFQDEWEWGSPTSGPGAARSGTRVWGTDLDGNYSDNASIFLDTPVFTVAALGPPRFSFWHWLSTQACCDAAVLQIAVEGGSFSNFPGLPVFLGPLGGYRRVDADLSPFVGQRVQLRFALFTDGAVTDAGWFIDDVRLPVRASTLTVLEPAADRDGDGLSNGVERDGGTDPLFPDTDGDGLGDGVETNSGVFVDAADTGTDPLDPDTDDGGLGDGLEVDLGLDPFVPADDLTRQFAPVLLADSEGFLWDVQGNGSVGDGSADAFDGGMNLRVGGLDFQFQSQLLVAGGESLVALGPQRLGGVDVTRQIFVPREGTAFARYIESFHNAGAGPIDLQVEIFGNVGADGGNTVTASSSGDLFADEEDRWFVTDDFDSGGDPTLAFIIFDGNSEIRPSDVEVAADNFFLRYALRIAAGETRSLMYFVAQNVSQAAARAKAELLADLDGGALAGLSEAVRARIVNFSRDSDGDGMPDFFERQNGLDPEDRSDGAGDVDGDGLTNSEEFELDTLVANADTDGDGLSDGEEVRVAGTSPTLADTDGDGRRDAVDPFPTGWIEAHLDLPFAAVSGMPVIVGARVESGGAPVPRAVPFTLTVKRGDARFAPAARVGKVITGGGSDTVLVESAGGRVEIDLVPLSQDELELDVIDSIDWGIVLIDRRVLDFESSDGGFTHGGVLDEWEWGIPRDGPGQAFSGQRVWGTDLDGTYENGVNCFLESPEFVVPRGPEATLRFRYWFSAEPCCDPAQVLVSENGGAFRTLPEPFELRGQLGGYTEAVIALDSFAGSRLRLRFQFSTDGSVVDAGWYIDDVTLPGTVATIPIVPAAGDPDGDGLENAVEVERGTDPFHDDSDGDGLKDSVETDTGVFAGSADTGTDPLDPDSDGGGMNDGREVELGLDPLDPIDDIEIQLVAWVAFADRFEEWPRTLEAMRRYFPDFTLTESTTIDPAAFARALEGKDVLVIPELEAMPDPFAFGALFADALRGFAAGGGVIVCFHNQGADMLHAAGIVESTILSVIGDFESLQLVDGAHPLAKGVSTPVLSQSFTATRSFFSDGVEVVLSRPTDGGAVVAMRRVGEGAAVLIGFDYFIFDDNAARFAANAIELGLEIRDTDGDGLPDRVESRFGLDPVDPADAARDRDGDGLSNVDEFRRRTRIDVADTDGDGLQDGEEVALGIDPLRTDSDRDGIPDAADPFPSMLIGAHIDAPPYALAGGAFPIKVELRGDDGPPLAGAPVRFTLVVGPAARISPEAEVGEIVSLDGGRALVEVADGFAILRLLADGKGDLDITVEDSESLGLSGEPALEELYRVNCGGDPHTDVRGRQWSGDRFFSGGQVSTFPGAQIANTDDSTIYRSERWANALAQERPFRYDFPVEPGRYAVDLYFAELRDEFAPPNPPRIFNVDIEGRRVLSDFDIISATGGMRVAGERRFETETLDSSLQVVFSNGSFGNRDPKISGIAVSRVVFALPSARTVVISPLADDDGDGLANEEELARGSNPRSADSDGDSVPDAVESGSGIFIDESDTGTSPIDPDTDGDGAADGLEIRIGSSPVDRSSAPTRVQGDVVLAGTRLTAGLKSEFGTLLTAGGQGLILRAAPGSPPIPDFLDAQRSHDLFSVRCLDSETGDLLRFVNDARRPAIPLVTHIFASGDALTAFSSGNSGPLAIVQRARIARQDSALELTVELENIGRSALRSLQYLRNADPRIDGDATANDVIESGIAIAEGPESGACFILGSQDARAVASAEGSRVTLPGSIIDSPVDPDGAVRDVALGVGFQLGDLAPGEKVEIRLIFALGATREEALGAFRRLAPSRPFERGNVNGDSRVDLTDGILILGFLFLGDADPSCMDAADADDDGAINITDALAIFRFLFLGLGDLPPPGAAGCGPDPTADRAAGEDLGCRVFAGCE